MDVRESLLSTMSGARSEPPCRHTANKTDFRPENAPAIHICAESGGTGMFLANPIANKQQMNNLTQESRSFLKCGCMTLQHHLACRVENMHRKQFACTFFGASFWDPKPSPKRYLFFWTSTSLLRDKLPPQPCWLPQICSLGDPTECSPGRVVRLSLANSTRTALCWTF